MKTVTVSEMGIDERNLIITIKNYAKVTGTPSKKIIKDMTEDLEDLIDAKMAEEAYREHLKNPEGAMTLEEAKKELGIR